MNENQFKISIITVCLNSEKTIERCIRSVLNQKYDKIKIELIVIDGGSNDNTIKIIKRYESMISHWQSEKDRGLYFAMNKGLKLANGDIIGILNSDDYYYPNTFKIVNEYFNKFNLDYLFGSINHHKIYHGFYPKKIWYKFNVVPSHSVSFFIKRISQFKVGFYNTKFKYSADRDLFYRLVKSNLKGMATKKMEIFGKFATDGLSSRLSYFSVLMEELKIRVNNKQNLFFLFFLFMATFVYKILAQILRKK